MVNDALFMGGYVCQSQAYQGTFAIYTKEDILETCAVLEVWYPHWSDISLPLGRVLL